MDPKTIKILKTIALWVFVPSAIVGAYYAGVYTVQWYKKYKAKQSGEPIDTIGMEPYVITIPFEHQQKYFTDGEFFKLIEDIEYAMKSDNVLTDVAKNPTTIEIHILTKPKDIDKFEKIFETENNGIKIQKDVQRTFKPYSTPLLGADTKINES